MTHLQPSAVVLSAPLKMAATAWPPVMKETLSVTSRPRLPAGAASAKNIGTDMLARPFNNQQREKQKNKTMGEGHAKMNLKWRRVTQK